MRSALVALGWIAVGPIAAVFVSAAFLVALVNITFKRDDRRQGSAGKHYCAGAIAEESLRTHAMIDWSGDK